MKDHLFVPGYVTKHLWFVQVIYAPSICARGAFLPQSKTLRTKSSAVLCDTRCTRYGKSNPQEQPNSKPVETDPQLICAAVSLV